MGGHFYLQLKALSQVIHLSGDERFLAAKAVAVKCSKIAIATQLQ